MAFRFHIPQYLSRRAADWHARGFTETLVDFPSLNARSKFWGDDGRAAFRNWEEVADPRNPLGGRQGVDERIMLRELLRRVDMMVLLENRLDALVRLHTPLPPAKIGGAPEPGLSQNLRPGIVLRPERRPDRDADTGRLRDNRLRPGLRPQRRPHALRPCRRRRPRPSCRRPACRSRWCSAPSRARRTFSSRSPPPTKPPPTAASRRPPSARCREGCAKSSAMAGSRARIPIGL